MCDVWDLEKLNICSQHMHVSRKDIPLRTNVVITLKLSLHKTAFQLVFFLMLFNVQNTDDKKVIKKCMRYYIQ